MHNAGQLAGRRVLVTGAASGMGRAIARLFIDEGAAVALLDRNAEGVERSAANMGAFGSTCDVADADAVNRVVVDSVRRLGGLDGLVNAAGVLVTKNFEELQLDDWDRMLAVNATGPFNVVKAALPALRMASSAAIVNIASVSGHLPMLGTAGYSASKAAALMLTKCLALELGPKIRVNAICPGVVKTEMTRYLWEDADRSARATERVALKRLGEPDHIARAALHLMSDDASFTTGAELTIDGGFSWR